MPSIEREIKLPAWAPAPQIEDVLVFDGRGWTPKPVRTVVNVQEAGRVVRGFHGDYLRLDCTNDPLRDDLEVLGHLEATDGLKLHGRKTSPADPPDGQMVMWLNDAGDLLIKITVGATTKTATLVDFATI